MSKVTNALKRSRARRAARERYLDAHPDVKVRSWYRSLRRAMEWMIAARIMGVDAMYPKEAGVPAAMLKSGESPSVYEARVRARIAEEAP